MKAKRYKDLKRVFSIFLVITFLMSSLSIPTFAKEAGGISPLQIVIVESMALDEAGRNDFVDNILEPINSQLDVNTTLIDRVKVHLPSMSLEDIDVALVEYSKIEESKKGVLNSSIRQGMEEITGTENFIGITERINDKIVGDLHNINGIRFLMKLLKTVSQFTGPIASDMEMDHDKIDFYLEGNVKINETVSILIDSLESLKLEINHIDEPTNFDKLLRYCEENVNVFSIDEIRNFKNYLDGEGIYRPNPDGNNPGEPHGPSIMINPDNIEEYYDDMTINVNGNGINFNESTALQIFQDLNNNQMIDPEEFDTQKINSINILNESELSFTLQAGLTAGEYIVKAQSQEEIATGSLHVNIHQGAFNFQNFSAVFDPADKSNSYIEFETREGDYSNTSKISFSLDGEYINEDYPILIDEFMNEEFNGAFNKENLIITNITDSTPITIADTVEGIRSFIKNPGNDVIGIEIPIITQQIEGNKTYRITFGDDLNNSIFSSSINSIVPLEGQTNNNLHFRLGDEWNGLAEENSVWNQGQVPQAKESLSEESIGLIGTERVKYGHMYNKDMSDVKEFGFYFFDNFSDFEVVAPTTEQSSNVFIADTTSSNVIVDETTSDSGNDIIYVGAQFEEVMDVQIEEVHEIEFRGDIGNYLNLLTKHEFSDEFGHGNLKQGAKVFSVIKDSQGRIVAWKEISETNEVLVANPDIEINRPTAGPDDFGYTEGDVMPFIGYHQEWEDQPRITIYGTGQEHDDQIIVDGETSYVVDGKTVTIPFVLRLNKYWGDNDQNYRDAFAETVHFVNKRETERYNSSSVDMNEFENGIPVDPLYENTITIFYEYLNIDKEEQVETSSFNWDRGILTPDEVWNWANLADEFYGFGPDSIVDIKVNGLEGNPANLTSEVKYYQYSGDNVRVDTLIELNGMEEVTDEYSMDENFEDNAQVFRFNYTTGTNFFDSYTGDLEDLNYIEARIFLKYNDVEVGKEPYEVAWTQIDTMPPSVNDWDGVKYNGVNEDETSDYYERQEVIVKFNDPIDFEDIKLNKDDYFTMLDRNGNVVEAAPFDVVGYRDEWEPSNPWDPYRNIKLYFNDIKSGNKLSIIGVSDQAGNTLTEKITKKISMQRKVNITLQYEDGQTVNNGSVEMVEINSILESEFGFNTKPSVDFRRFEISEWNYDNWLDIGTYRVFKAEDRSNNQMDNPDMQPPPDPDNPDMQPPPMTDTLSMDPVEDEDRNGQYSIDQEITIPFSPDSETALEIVITIPDDNVKGKVTFDPEYPEDGMELIVLNTEYLTGEWAEILEADEHIIYEVFAKRLSVSAVKEEGEPVIEGEFKGYLTPGEYKVIGKMSGFSVIEPENTPYIFTVPESELEYTDGIYNIYEDYGSVVFPKMNVIGKLSTSTGNIFNNSVVLIKGETSEGVKKEASAVTNYDGLFATSLPEGSYSVEFVQVNNHPETWNSGMFQLNVSFDVVVDTNDIDGDFDVEELITVNILGSDLVVEEGSTATLKDIVVPDSNVNFTVSNGEVNENNEPVPVWGAQLELVIGDDEGGPFFWSDSGKFDFYLKEGNYKIARAGSWEMFIDDLDFFFNVSNEEVITDSESNILGNSINIDLTESSNLSVRVFETILNENGEPEEAALQNAGIQIEGKSNGIWSWRNTNSNGMAYFNLEPGKYRVAGYDKPGSGWQQYDLDFEIVKGEKTELIIEIKPPNVTGIAYTDQLDDDGNFIPLSDGWVDFERLPGEGELFSENFGAHTARENEFENEGEETEPPGYFALSLEDGTYIVRSAGNWENWFEVNIKFSIKDGQLLDKDGTPIETLEVKKPSPNIKGKVYKNELQELFQGNQNQGNNGPASRTGTEPIEQPEENPVEEPSIEPTEPEVPEWIDVWLVLKQTNVDEESYKIAPWIYEKWVEVEYDGSFEIAVNDANRYKPTAITNAGRWIELDDTSIRIEDPEGIFRAASEELGEIENDSMVPNVNTTFVIIPPVPNFSGTMKDFNDNIVGPGWLNIERIDENGYFSDWRGMEVDSNGEFGVKLVEGDTYIIRDAWIRDESQDDPWMNQRRYSFNRRVTIGKDASDIVLKPNTNIKVDLGGEIEIDEENQWYNIGTNIRKILDESDENYDDYQMNPWMYETWADLEYNSDEGVYELYTYLDMGSYELIGISFPNGWKEVNEIFNVISESSNEILINAVPNVTGTVTNSEGNPVDEAWIDFERVSERNNNHNDPGSWDNRWFSTNSDSNGNFSLKLSDNEENEYYKVRGYHTPGTWENNNWIPGNRVEVNYMFKVVDGQLSDINGNPLDSIDLSTNIKGMFKRVYKSGRDNPNKFIDPVNGEESQIREAWFTIKPYKTLGETDYIDYADWNDTIWANTNGTGEFNLMLSDGKYMLLDVGTMNNWYNLEITFEVSDGSLVESMYVVDGVLVAKPPIQNFSGFIFRDPQRSEAVKWGSFSVKPKNSSEHDWSNMKWFGTKSDGSFEGNLGQGEWKVVEISGPGYWERVNIPLTVDENLNLSSPWDENVDIEDVDNRIVVPDDNYEFGKVVISQKEPNVKGIVKDSNGERLNQNAWVTIKPAEASANDWSAAIGCEYNWYDGELMFKTNLDVGDYKVVDVGSWNFWYETDVPFSVDEDGMVSDEDSNGELDNGFEMLNVNGTDVPVVVIEPPTPNVVGTIYSGETTATDPLMYGWLSLARFDESGTQLTMDGYEITPLNGGWKGHNEDVYWMHTRWTGTDENGAFELKLQDGYYKIISVNGMDVWYQPEKEFMVQDGILKNMSVEAINEVVVTKPGPNIEITIKNSGSTDSSAWIDIKDMDNGMIFGISSTTKDSDGNFIFREKLKDGPHKAVGFFSKGQWREIETEVFEVPTDGEVVYDFNSNVKETVQGMLYTSGNLAAGSGYKVLIQKVENGELVGDTKQVKTTDTGSFEFMLNPDEVWAVISIASIDGANKYTTPVNGNTFTIVDTESNEQSGWDIVISDIS